MRFRKEFALLFGCVLAACTEKQQGTDTNETSDGDTDQVEDTDQTDTDSEVVETYRAVSGDVTWSVEFDADAQAAGLEDCEYTRTYMGFEDRSAPWICPECEVIFRSEVSLTGQECFEKISSRPLIEVEWHGFGTVEDSGQQSLGYFRTYYENYRLSQQGSVVVSDSGFDVENESDWYEHPDGGNFRFRVSGSFDETLEEGDVFHGYTPPETYACGWPKSDSPIEITSAPIVVGEELPDGLFLDSCGEAVRLHDFDGRYLVIDVAAMNCGPCQSMADTHDEFEAAMQAAGIDAVAITLLAPSLSNVLGTTTRENLNDWVTSFGLSSPVLADRGYGYWLLGGNLGDSFGYPAWAVVAPDLEVLEVGVGFSSWSNIEGIIVGHHSNP